MNLCLPPISLARQGGVDTIANDYTQRATPTIVALGGRQRFMGVSAENQRNLTVKNTVSYFKNFLGRKFKDEYVQRKIGQVGAEVVELQNEQPGFRVQGEDYRPEQLLAMMFTKCVTSSAKTRVRRLPPVLSQCRCTSLKL